MGVCKGMGKVVGGVKMGVCKRMGKVVGGGVGVRKGMGKVVGGGMGVKIVGERVCAEDFDGDRLLVAQ